MSDSSHDALPEEFGQQTSELLAQAMIKIRHCLNQLTVDQIWWRPDESLNSIGNLVLHLDGNLRQWGVVPFTGVKDERDRESEFTSRQKLPATVLLQRLTQTVNDAQQAWSGVTSAHLTARTRIQGFEGSFLKAILHASSHFVGHSHQIILLTRLQLGSEYRFQWTPESERGSLPI